MKKGLLSKIVEPKMSLSTQTINWLPTSHPKCSRPPHKNTTRAHLWRYHNPAAHNNIPNDTANGSILPRMKWMNTILGLILYTSSISHSNLSQLPANLPIAIIISSGQAMPYASSSGHRMVKPKGRGEGVGEAVSIYQIPWLSGKSSGCLNSPSTIFHFAVADIFQVASRGRRGYLKILISP
ncbi:hypothetical protein EIKCOROL_01888 [Eikenella corrodens ATCC 23834]|uniref:Uncharacterized protein n=1 Tax=Eikenella corrodens ATCC 23834 TaxID=546274 RepID=C0DWY5_EIKCO|nr:hypothetical protein EIKCOROL_01888 [Eikenella corrodens ATCC 23834]